MEGILFEIGINNQICGLNTGLLTTLDYYDVRKRKSRLEHTPLYEKDTKHIKNTSGDY